MNRVRGDSKAKIRSIDALPLFSYNSPPLSRKNSASPFLFFLFLLLLPQPLLSALLAENFFSLFPSNWIHRNHPVLNDLGYNNAMKSRPVLGVQLYSNATTQDLNGFVSLRIKRYFFFFSINIIYYDIVRHGRWYFRATFVIVQDWFQCSMFDLTGSQRDQY